MSIVKHTLAMGTYNARSARGESLELLLAALSPMNLDICVITETNLQGYHTLEAQGFEVFATSVSNPRVGGVAILFRSMDKNKQRNWHIESPMCHGENVVSAILVSGWRKWIVIDMYLPPSLQPDNALEHVRRASERLPLPTIVLGDLN